MTGPVTITGDPEPDQQPHRWDDHVIFYEDVFEPLTQNFALAAIEALSLEPRSRVLDSGAGTGGAALELARRGHGVTAIDASMAMVGRATARASAAALRVEVLNMDGQNLSFPDGSFDAALSVLGVILFPDAVRGLSELRRAVRPGGRIALVTWTAPEAYELIGELRAAAVSVLGSLPSRPLPAQLRFKEKENFQALFAAAGLPAAEIAEVAGELVAPSPAWLAERLSFAPGMAALLEGFGAARAEVITAFRKRLEARGSGRVALLARAYVGTVTVAHK
ncbi:MAG TPA: class I SAM-dependent methyltransferase [Steroidobacteraceae bacterium]